MDARLCGKQRVPFRKLASHDVQLRRALHPHGKPWRTDRCQPQSSCRGQLAERRQGPRVSHQYWSEIQGSNEACATTAGTRGSLGAGECVAGSQQASRTSADASRASEERAASGQREKLLENATTGVKNPRKWPYTGDPAGEHVLTSETTPDEPPELSSREHDGKKQNIAARPGGWHERSEGDHLTGPHADRRTSNLWIPGVRLQQRQCATRAVLTAGARALPGIVQLKKERLIHTTRCQVYETIQTQFCGFQSRAGATRYIKLREALNMEPANCRLAEKTRRIKINGKEQVIQIGVSTSFHTYLKGGVDINNNCEVGTYEYDGKEYTKQVVLASYEVLLRQEWARANDITGMLTMASDVIAPTTDRSIMDSAEGTYVWNHSEESCPDTIVKLYSGPIKVLTNTSSTFNGGLAIVEGRDKNQVAGLELTETFLLCGRAAQKTLIRNIVVFFHPMSQIQVASGKFDAATTEASITRLESELSFLQVKATMTLQERIWQVKGDICENRRQIAQLRLESIAKAENLYSLIQVFRRGHQVTRNGATVYVTRCHPVEVTPRMHVNCTSEIPVTVNNTNLFVDPISFVIKAAASPFRCNDIAPPRWKLGGKW
jgi:hypothetical protein